VERTDWLPADILKYFADVVQPMHEQYIETTKANADLIIHNEYDPALEAQRSGLHEIQEKFRGTLDGEFLRKAGAERLGSVIQSDTYYNPPGRDLLASGEMLRIRRESDHLFLTYKGPKCVSQFCKRPKFEFEINEDVAQRSMTLYGAAFKRIEKNPRTLYYLDGIIIALDNDVELSNGDTKSLGQFIEFRCIDNGHADCSRMSEAIVKLGLKIEDGITSSYLEMV